MQLFQFKFESMVPESYREDVRELQRFILDNLDIHISLTDTYLFWETVSDSWSASWLCITAHYEHQTREEFLLDKLNEFGCVI